MINNVSPIRPEGNEGLPQPKPEQATEGASSFKDMLAGFVNDVNKMQLNADESIKKLATGEIKDVHQAMLAVSEADVSFKLMMEIRRKLMEAYKEVMKTQV